MKTIYKIAALLLFAILFTSNISYGQTQPIDLLQHQITWTASSNKDLASGQTFEKSMHFITYSSEKIELRGRSSIQTFTITSTEGSWSNINLPGQMIYHIVIDGQNGLITLQKTSEGIFLTLDMSISSAEGIRRKFTIDSFEVNQ